jgi:hypothetical protein
MSKGRKWMFFILFAPIGIALFVFIGGESVKLLWNWLVPDIFGWRVISFWQALGLLALSRILFGGFGGSRFSRSRHITPEDKERFRQRVRERWGSGPSVASEATVD